MSDDNQATQTTIEDPELQGGEPGEETEEPAQAGEEQNSPSEILSKIMETYGIDSPEDLAELLERHSEVQDALGDRDLEQLIEDSSTLGKYREHWKAAKEKKQLEDESYEETIARQERELKELRSKEQKREMTAKEKQKMQEAVKRYNAEIGKTVKTQNLPKAESKLLSLLLGVDNPSVEVDIMNRKAVTEMARGGVKTYNDLISQIKQSAVDEYAAGKSALTPRSPTKGKQPQTKVDVQEKEVPKGISAEQAFALAADELMEVLEKSMK